MVVQDGGQIRYLPITAQYPAQGFFSIQPTSGQISIIRSMKEDYDHTLEYSFEVHILYLTFIGNLGVVLSNWGNI